MSQTKYYWNGNKFIPSTSFLATIATVSSLESDSSLPSLLPLLLSFLSFSDQQEQQLSGFIATSPSHKAKIKPLLSALLTVLTSARKYRITPQEMFQDWMQLGTHNTHKEGHGQNN